MQKSASKTTLYSYLTAIVCCVVAIALDQFTKWLAVVHLKGQDAFVLIPGVFELRYLENRGAAFGIFQDRQFMFLIGGLLVLAAVVYFYWKLPHTKRFTALRFCMVLVSAGAIGNMIDRVIQNYVVDFFYFSLIDFPIFNVADCYVVVACIIFAILILFFYKDDDFTWKN